LFGAVILLLPVIQARRERRRVWTLLIAAIVPITLIGLALMSYNSQRFDSPFEFGTRYQLAAQRQVTQQFFGLRNLWFNFRVYFLEPARWSARFPFVRGIVMPPVPPGHSAPERPFGVLTNIPFVWLALAAPLACRHRTAEARSTLCALLSAAALLFGICASVLCLYCAATWRYEVEFLPALELLAVVGILGLERVLADWLAWRRVARWCWGVLLGFSVAFNLLASTQWYASGQFTLGVALVREQRVPEAVQVFEEVLRLQPDFTDAHFQLGNALCKLGKVDEAVAQYQEALRIDPRHADAHYNLGYALFQMGEWEQAVEQYKQALRLKPDNAAAHEYLGDALVRQGKVAEALPHYQQASRMAPEDAAIRSRLGAVLMDAGKPHEAITHLERALQIQPDLTEAQNNLAWLLATLAPADGGDPVRAVSLAQQACERTRNRLASYLDTLAAAYAAAGRFDDAIATAQKAIETAHSAGQANLVGEM